MPSGILKLNKKDLVNGLIVAVFSAIAPMFTSAISNGTFDIFSMDWVMVGKFAVNGAVAYMIKKLLSDESGKVFGRIG